MATYNGHQEDASGNILLSIGNGMTATLETGTTASQAYTKGTYIFFNNKLCKATTAITSGSTLAIGTNLAQTSIGAELSSHLRANNGDEFYFDYKDGKAGYYPTASKISSQFVPFGGTVDFTTVVSDVSTYTITESGTYLCIFFYLNGTNSASSTDSINNSRKYLKLNGVELTDFIYDKSVRIGIESRDYARSTTRAIALSLSAGDVLSMYNSTNVATLSVIKMN